MSKGRCSIKKNDSRRYPIRPILGVGALIFKRDRVLMVQRGTEPLKGFWSLPGGALEPGETLAEGVCREVLEETGLIVKPIAQAKIFERIMRDEEGRPEYHYVLIDFVCKPVDGELAPASDASRAEWIRLKDLQKYPITGGTLEVIEEVYAKRKRGPARV